MVKKAAPKIQKKATEAKKPIEKTKAIAKVKQAPKTKARGSNPKPKQPKQARVAQGPLKFYTVGEDSQILDALRKADNKTTKSALAKEMAHILNRSVESVRDRIKRYITKLSASDAKEIQKVAKKNPDHYAYFKGGEGTKKLEQISANEPFIYQRELARRPRQSKAVKKPAQSKKVNFDWLLRKINASDPYFAIDHSVHLLNSVFAKLMEDKVERKDIETFINGQDGEVTLFEILSNFVKRDQKQAKSK